MSNGREKGGHVKRGLDGTDLENRNRWDFRARGEETEGSVRF